MPSKSGVILSLPKMLVKLNLTPSSCTTYFMGYKFQKWRNGAKKILVEKSRQGQFLAQIIFLRAVLIESSRCYFSTTSLALRILVRAITSKNLGKEMIESSRYYFSTTSLALRILVRAITSKNLGKEMIESPRYYFSTTLLAPRILVRAITSKNLGKDNF